MEIDVLIQAIESHRVRITDHADEEVHADNLVLDDIYFSVSQGEIIEDYPTDFPFPSCLVYGNTKRHEPVHSVWAYNADTLWAVLITVYRPDPNQWINWRERKKDS